MILIDFGIICREQKRRSVPKNISKVRFESHIRKANSDAMYDDYYHFEDADKLTGVWYLAWLTDDIFLEQSFFDIADKGSPWICSVPGEISGGTSFIKSADNRNKSGSEIMKLVIASNNKGKIREYKQILEKHGYEVMSQSEAGLDLEVEETGTTFAENSALKARAAYEKLGCAVLADDSGLSVDALNGEPGVYSARYGGIDDDKERCLYMLKKMENVPDDKRGAHFVCTIHFIDTDGSEICVEGRVYGKINRALVGENGFGYDPVFMYEGRSFAEIPAEEKNAVSHRANALKQLEEKLAAR